MDDAKVASAQVWPRRPVDCEQLFFTGKRCEKGGLLRDALIFSCVPKSDRTTRLQANGFLNATQNS